MAVNYLKTFTKPITTAVTLVSDDFVVGYSLKVVAGTCTILGAAKFQGQDSVAITLSEGDVYTKLAPNGSFLVGDVVTPTGTTNIEILK